MKKLILVACLLCTAGIAEASSNRHDHHGSNNRQVVQAVINTSLGVLQVRPRSSQINIVIINTPPARKVYHFHKRPVVSVVHFKNHKGNRKKVWNKHHHHSHKVKNHRSKVHYTPYYYN